MVEQEVKSYRPNRLGVITSGGCDLCLLVSLSVWHKKPTTITSGGGGGTVMTGKKREENVNGINLARKRASEEWRLNLEKPSAAERQKLISGGGDESGRGKKK